MRWSAALLMFAAGCGSAPSPQAAPDYDFRTVEYRDGVAVLEGYLAKPGDFDSGNLQPAVLVVHEWWGRTAHADRSAERLAESGYAALAVDMYGKGKVTSDPGQAGAWAAEFRKDPEKGIRRLRAALDILLAQPGVDRTRVACIGFCFGGTVSLEAAWAGLDLRAVVSFHGSLTTPRPEQAAGVKASVLVCHGADDPFVPRDAVDAFEKSMKENRFDWQFASYGGAVHSFTNPQADGSLNPGAKYHPAAAARAWSLAESFLAERLR